MLKCGSVCTREVDNSEAALEEIQAQLSEEISLLEHSIGIIMCHAEFVASGVMQHICENLPFETVGITTSSQAINNESGELLFTLFIMTSNDVVFRAGITSCLENKLLAPIQTAYEKASVGMTEAPKLGIIFPPLILSHAGDSFVDAWKHVANNMPLFGAGAVDDTLTFEDSETLYNGIHSRTALSFVLCYGSINPRFLVGTLPEDKVMPYKGEVTKASGPYVYEINNCVAYQYFESIGFISNGLLKQDFLMVPFAIDQKKREDYDGIPVIRRHASFMDDGTAIFRGIVDEGSTFTPLACNSGDVLEATQQTMQRVNALSNVNGVLMFSCAIRRMMTTGVHPLVELQTIAETIDPAIHFMAGYAGGEFCPTSVRDGVPTNRFHNYSFIVLVV